MVRTDEDALICDFAETYHIFNYRDLPVLQAATLAIGLRPDSRIKQKLSGMNGSRELMLLAAAVDRLSLLVWSKTTDAERGINKPVSVLATLFGIEPESKGNVVAFENGSDFVTKWNEITGG